MYSMYVLYVCIILYMYMYIDGSIYAEEMSLGFPYVINLVETPDGCNDTFFF